MRGGYRGSSNPLPAGKEQPWISRETASSGRGGKSPGSSTLQFAGGSNLGIWTSRALKNTLCGGYRGSSDPLPAGKEQPWDFPGKIATAGRPRTLCGRAQGSRLLFFNSLLEVGF